MRTITFALALFAFSTFSCSHQNFLGAAQGGSTSTVEPDTTQDSGISQMEPDAGQMNTAMGGMVSTQMAPTYPRDGVLRLNHIQIKGTHNSYHIATKGAPAEYQYTHAPLTEQLEKQGVRAFELDLHFNIGGIEVYHLDKEDPATRCRALKDCLSSLMTWSAKNPGHIPLFVMFEPKDAAEFTPTNVKALDALIRSVVPEEKLMTPAKLAGTYATPRERIEAMGYPTLGAVRNTIFFMVQQANPESSTIIFPVSVTGLDKQVFYSTGKPVGVLGGAAFDFAMKKNGFIRARADDGLVEAVNNDKSVLEAALTKGAHVVSTDFPAKVSGYDYWVDIPKGFPGRCNPVTAPTECESKDIENLSHDMTK